MGAPRFIVQQLKGTVLQAPYFRDLEYMVKPNEIDSRISKAVNGFTIVNPISQSGVSY